jgi:hypothetical protein
MSQTAARAAQVDKIKNQMMQVCVSFKENRRTISEKSSLYFLYRFRKTLCMCRGHNQIKSGIIYY